MAGIRILHISNQHLTEKFPIKYVNSHRSQITLRFFRFLLEFYNLSFFVCVHDTETASFFHRDLDNCNCRIGIVCLVLLQHLRIIHLINVIAGKNKYIFRIVCVDEINVL